MPEIALRALHESPGIALSTSDADGHGWPRSLDCDWQCVSTPAGACAAPHALPAEGWLPAQVPGTVASAWRAAGRLDVAHPPPFAFDDHWYRATFVAHGRQRLRLHGLATLAEVWIGDRLLLTSDSMFVAHDVEFDADGAVTLALCFRSLAPALAARRTRARWRPRLVTPPTLRNVRTTLLGHMPGWCPPLQAVGPWRAVETLGRGDYAFDTVDLVPSVDGASGVIELTVTFAHPQPEPASAAVVSERHSAPLHWSAPNRLTGTLRIADAERWWPHTHGAPKRYPVELRIGAHAFALGHVGFRTIDVDRGSDDAGFALRINGVQVFCRGACWTSADLATLAGTRDQLSAAFALARDAGMNMLRVGGTMVYESDTFYDLADEYGILIWQDFAFANFDYPADADFARAVDREATQFLRRTRARAALAVLCGGSEADQQAGMFGLPPGHYEQELFATQLPALVARHRPDVPYVRNSPSGGTWPFSTRSGVTHYYGVGAYQRPLDDVRRSQVRFTSECLAFANVPDDATLHDAPGTIHAHDPRWKTAVPRDPGAGWDFDDVRDHYVHALYGIEPARLRYEDPTRYLDLSRAVVAELMTDVFSEWRRGGSSCAGALVWQYQDLRAGAGWGVIDALGRPKSAWYALRRVLQPVQVVLTDEGLNGLDLHVVNDTAQTLALRLEFVCLRDGALVVASASRAVTLAPRSTQTHAAADLLGRFFDMTCAYRFGPPPLDVAIATLTDAQTGERYADAFYLPDRSAHARHDLGLVVTPQPTADGWQLVLETQRFARYVQIIDAHYRPRDNWFHLAPGRALAVPLVPGRDLASAAPPHGEVRAINAGAPVFY